MSLLASLALTFALAPQGEQTPKPLLAPNELATLHDRLVAYMDAMDAYDAATGDKRQKANRAYEKTKQQFMDEWESRSKKVDILASVPDLQAIFTNCFKLDAPKMSLGPPARKDKIAASGLEFSVYLPKNYKPGTPQRTVLVMPGSDGTAGSWIDGARYWEMAWDKTGALADTIFHMSHLPPNLEMDPVPDHSIEEEEEKEQRRIAAVWATYGQTMNAMNVDRARLYLDCGRDNCGFGLRFASLWPDRFAGVILRHPTTVDGIRLGTLTGLPILMLRTQATAAAVDTLKTQLEALGKDKVTVVEVTDEYPHKAAAPEIEKWMAANRRNMFPTRVVIEPNHDRYKKAYWVAIEAMDSLQTAPADAMPRIEVEADRQANRITVKSQGVDAFTLMLNDQLVDLGKEFTVIVNDKAFTEKRVRDFKGMEERMKTRRDWDYLFPVTFQCRVPKPAADAAGSSGGSK